MLRNLFCRCFCVAAVDVASLAGAPGAVGAAAGAAACCLLLLLVVVRLLSYRR